MVTTSFDHLPFRERLKAFLVMQKQQLLRDWGVPELFSFCIGLLVIGIIASTTWFFTSRGPVLIPSGSYTLIPLLAVVLFALARKRPLLEGSHTLSVAGIGGLFLILLFSDWFERSYNFFPDPYVRGEILLFAILFAFATLKGRTVLLLLSPLLIAALLFATFMAEADGRLIFSDDHASFLFRLSLLKENFPRIPFFYPGWNAGLDARDFFATGALSSFFLFSPLIYLFSVESVYNLMVGLTLFALLPLSTFFAGRMLGFNLLSQALGAALSMSAGLVWYRWALKYGTMGFIIAAALAPLVLALTYRMLNFKFKPSWGLVLAWLLATSLMLLWSLSGALLIPAICIGAFFLLRGYFSKNFARPSNRHLIAGALLIALNLPWIALFWSVSNVSGFVSTPAQSSSFSTTLAPESAVLSQDTSHKGFRHRAGAINLKKSLAIVREKSISTNPLILFFALPGVFLLSARGRVLYFLSAAWLGFLGSIAVPLKPQLELDRMLLILTLVLTPLAGAALAKYFTTPLSDFLTRTSRAVVAGFFFVSPFCTAAILSNRTVEQYHFASPLVDNLSRAIRNFGGDGRTVFLGCIVHQLDEGHVAPLSLMSGKPLVASAPFHTLWKYTQVIPKSFIERGEAGIEEYLDLVNATAVIAHEKEWREYLRARPEKYKFEWKEGRFLLFSRTHSSNSYFVSGAGTLLDSTTSEMRFAFTTPDALLKIKHFPFLEAPGCTLTPEQVAPELVLVKLTGCSLNTPITIRSIAPWRRIQWP